MYNVFCAGLPLAVNTCRHKTWMSIANRISCVFLGMLLLASSGSAWAFSTAPVDRFIFSASVAPRVSTVGTPRSIFVNGCVGPGVIDDTGVVTGTLVLRVSQFAIGCVQPPTIFQYTPRGIGSLRVVVMLPDGGIGAEAQMDTVTGTRSTVNLDGMWFDPATNGSGISFHHSAATDGVFGTWFLYGASNAFVPRWYSLQSMQWMKSGNLLVGVAYDAMASGLMTCVKGDDCPRPAALTPVGSVAITVIDKDNLRIEAFDQYGRGAFGSLVKRLF